MCASKSRQVNERKIPPGADLVDVTFVVIGLNEAPTLEACLKSVSTAQDTLTGQSEVIYVDGGSQDDSIDIAKQAGVQRILGGDRRRKAAENRNLGLREARGQCVQFVDGDMMLDCDWPQVALDYLVEHPETAAVCGDLEEVREDPFHTAKGNDWALPAGPNRYCGGAAMFSRDVVRGVGGFPEDVQYGEEPYLCWRIRNELDRNVVKLPHAMARHDFAYTGLLDYCRRTVRVGESYAEICARCVSSADPLWFREVVSNTLWTAAIATAAAGLLVGHIWLKTALLAAVALLLTRKTVQTALKGHCLAESVIYALHVYSAKPLITLGQLRWLFWRLPGVNRVRARERSRSDGESSQDP